MIRFFFHVLDQSLKYGMIIILVMFGNDQHVDVFNLVWNDTLVKNWYLAFTNGNPCWTVIVNQFLDKWMVAFIRASARIDNSTYNLNF